MFKLKLYIILYLNPKDADALVQQMMFDDEQTYQSARCLVCLDGIGLPICNIIWLKMLIKASPPT